MTRSLYLYFIFLSCLAFIHLPSLDSYYYWTWSQHLDLSYYDGSPMIAYWIKIFTLLFGDTLLALSLLSISIVALSSFIIYRTALLFMSEQASTIATALWLFSPLVTLSLLKQITYDGPLALFWTLTLYYVCQFIKATPHPPTLSYPSKKYLYASGCSAGCLLLSKYSGVVLLLGLCLFLLCSAYRSLFKSIHTYSSLCITVLLFSPVLWWNAQHDWVSFAYQFTTHQLTQSAHPFYQACLFTLKMLIPACNFLLIPPFFFLRQKHVSYYMLLCIILSLSFLGFYLSISTFAHIRCYWLTPYLITAVLLVGIMYDKYKQLRQAILSLIGLYLFISLSILFMNTTQFSTGKRTAFIDYQLMQQFNAQHPYFNTPVVSTSWFSARMLFFLKNKPPVYTMPCGSENQYQFWRPQTLPEAFYIDTVDNSACMKVYFKTCQPQPTLLYKTHPLYIYQCQDYQHEGSRLSHSK